MKSLKKYPLDLIAILIIAITLRVINLGYSDYQGDEIKALYLPTNGQNLGSFLMDQRKGPVQFVISYLVKFINPSYDNQFLSRIVFSIAGILAVYFFFLLIKLHFGRRMAFYSAFFLATNGFFVAFSRIVQYQSLVILFMILTLYLYSLAVINEKYRTVGILLGTLFWSLGILSHYDAIFILPFAGLLILKWFNNSKLQKRKKFITMAICVVMALSITGAFYVPFISNLSEDTASYWQGRITGSVSSYKISSSLYLFTVYQPIYVIHLYKVILALGVILALLSFLSRFRKIRRGAEKLRILLVDNQYPLIGITVWLLIGVVFMEAYVSVPGTHIYVYLLPMMVYLGLGIYFFENVFTTLIKGSFGKVLFFTGTFVVFAFIYAQSFCIYVDHTTEYPWSEKKFLLWMMPKANATYHISIFGFPYNRDWEGIRDFLKSIKNPPVQGYSSNERDSITRYYLNYPKSADLAGPFVYIKSPQTFTDAIYGEKQEYWLPKYAPVFTLSKNGEEIVRIYIMPQGNLREIRAKGY